MIDIVDITLKQWRASSFEWGDRDCMLSIGDYIADRGGMNVSDRYRGTYDSEAGALAHMEAAGGAAALVDLTGIDETDRPSRGDVVVLDVGGQGIGGLCTGQGVALRRERGVVEIDIRHVRIIKAWKCPR